MKRWGLGALVFFLVLGCQTASKKTASEVESSDLSWEQAKARKERVSEVSYALAVSLDETSETFQGKSVTTFQLKDASKPLRVDFYEGRVSRISLNDRELDVAAVKRRYFLELPAGALKVGANVLTVDYVQDYSRQGQGLHRFVDPEDKKVFLYSQFETFDANRFMPCFDQPDLQAVLALSVTAPSSWEVVTTTPEIRKERKGAVTEWTFKPTPPLATYLFSLHAGPYKVWNDKHMKIPLRLFVRPSLAKYVKTKDWFTFTKQGLGFYEKYYAVPYPFEKYDQLIVPEFNAGAMENPGAVTFSEWFVPRSEPTRQQRRQLAGVLLHEMAHIWFGDLVTMTWWNDLWLNESFATSMSSLAMNEVTEFSEEWQDFFAGSKRGAYWQDGLAATHPIEAPVHTVKQAFANFDAITYGKGAAVLKQLRAYVKPENFRAGIQTYLKRHAFANATLEDFIGAQREHTDKDLKLWADRWLRQSGTDTVAAEWNCEKGRLRRIRLVTTPSTGAAFRPQVTNIGLFRERAGRVGETDSIRVELTAADQTVNGDWTCPEFVFPNAGDHGYMNVKMDERSLDFAKEHLYQFTDDLTRTMVWSDLWRMVRASELPLKEYVRVVDVNFPTEKNEILLDLIVSTISGRWGEGDSILTYWPRETSASRESRLAFIGRMEKAFLAKFESAKTLDERKLWFDHFTRLAQTPEGLKQIAAWFDARRVAPGFTLDPDRRWSLVGRLQRYGHPKAAESLAILRKQDDSDRGKKNALSIEAVKPDPQVKRKWVEILKQEKPPLSVADARSVAYSLFPSEQKDLLQPFLNDYYDYLSKYAAADDEAYVSTFASALDPLRCRAEDSSRLSAFVEARKEMMPTLRKRLSIRLEEDERCQKIRAASAL